MEVVQSLHSCSQMFATALEEMASFRPLLGKKVEVISRNIESARKLRSPDADEDSIDTCKLKFRLNRRSFGERKPLQRLPHGACMYVSKVAVDAEGIKEIVRIAIPITDLCEVLEA